MSLWEVCRKGKIYDLQTLIYSRADINRNSLLDGTGETPLSLALLHGQTDIANCY